MAFVTNQWLKGRPEKRRGHGPVEVALDAASTLQVTTGEYDQWDKDHGVIFEITAKRQTSDYLTLYLTQQDVDKLLNRIVSWASQEAIKSAFSRLSGMLDDTTILDELCRARKSKQT